MLQDVQKPKAARAVHETLYQALAAAQAEMGPALKDSTNPAFKTRYADLASVMAACLPALNAHGIAVLQPPCEIDGVRYVKTILAHESGETSECLVPLIISKNDMQGYGSAVTYARRYGLMAMAGVAPDDDDGNAAAAAAPARQEAQRSGPNGAAAPARQEAKRPVPTAVEVACNSFGKTDSLQSLKAIWDGLPVSVRGDQRVVDAKEAAKARLTKTADLGCDEIPY